MGSSQIHVQGRYGAGQWNLHGWSSMRSLAFGGQFLQGHILIVEAMDGRITWDGEAVMQGFPSDWEATGLVKAHFYEKSTPIDLAQIYRPIHGVELELPLGVKVIVNRWSRHLDLNVTMRVQEGG